MCLRLAAILAIGGLFAGCGSSDSGCRDDSDCSSGLFCAGGDCIYNCVIDSDCPEGQACDARGRCVEDCTPRPEGELCNGLDDDCDGQTDEDFTELGRPCSYAPCPPGEWICAADGLGTSCDAQRPAPADSTCDGLDEDCDGQTDEDVAPRPCPLQAGVCQGAEETCIGAGQWSGCDYGPDYTPEHDAICDGIDSDCDGQIDEDAEPLAEPETGASAQDGLDNNCNGLIDEPGGAMVPIPSFPGVWMDVYEIAVYEQADCSGTIYGQENDDYPAEWPASGTAAVELYACALPGVVPSGHLSLHRARRACRAQGKRLCSRHEWTSGCYGVAALKYPYGQAFVGGMCNDALAGSGAVEPAGARPECCSDIGTCDTSGNLAEWVDDESNGCPGEYVLAGFSHACVRCDCGGDCSACTPEDTADVEQLTSCLVAWYVEHSRPPATVRPEFGTRCCYEP